MVASDALFRSDSETELYPCATPHREEFRLVLSRLGTFSNVRWPHSSPGLHPFQLSEAGFYYVGRLDQVKCWYCGADYKGGMITTIRGKNTQSSILIVNFC